VADRWSVGPALHAGERTSRCGPWSARQRRCCDGFNHAGLKRNGAFQQPLVLTPQILQIAGQALGFFPHRTLGKGAVLGLRRIGLGEGIGGSDLAVGKLRGKRKIKLCQSFIFRPKGIGKGFAGNQQRIHHGCTSPVLGVCDPRLRSISR
jgi:hypothetical protein